MAKRAARAATTHVTRAAQLRSWWSHHFGCLNESLLRLVKKPLSSLLTVAVLAIALALPGGLYMLTQNVLALSIHWDADTQVTLYLQENMTDQAAEEFALDLQKDPRLQHVEFMSRDRALDEFRQMTGFEEALDKIEHNPLPPVILTSPTRQLDTAALSDLVNDLSNQPQVEQAQLDLEWIKRLNGIIEIIQRGLLVAVALLAIAVILVVGNTIRLEIENRRDEIVITKLFGATHAFIRRPFLYDGMWFGFMGGVFSCILIYSALWLLSEPVARLIALYSSDFEPIYPGVFVVIGITLFGSLLGYLGAWTAVTQHLYKIEPE